MFFFPFIKELDPFGLPALQNSVSPLCYICITGIVKRLLFPEYFSLEVGGSEKGFGERRRQSERQI